MKKELIAELFEKFEAACYLYNDIECWSARELQIILGYTKWSNFQKVIEKAKEAAQNVGEPISNHFADVGKMVNIGSDTKRQVKDVALPVTPVTSLLKMVKPRKTKLLLHKPILQFKHASKKLSNNVCSILLVLQRVKGCPIQKKNCPQLFLNAVSPKMILHSFAQKEMRHYSVD